MSRAAIIDWATQIYEDLDHRVVREWLAMEPRRKAIGHLPVYAPKEIIRALGMLPVGVHGGGDRIEIIKGDAFYQSYICHLPRSVIEMAQSGMLDMLSGMLFPSTCDVIRNLSGIWKLQYPDIYVRYLDVPQVEDVNLAAEFWAAELRVLFKELADVAGQEANTEKLREALALYNRVRQTVRALYSARQNRPWRVPSEELYVLLRAGEVVTPELFIHQAIAYLAAIEAEPDHIKDKTRVIVVGAFCEQPPLGLIKTIERAGCYIVDDDFLLGNRFLEAEVPLTGDPLEALAQTFVQHAVKTSVNYERDPQGKRMLMRHRVVAAKADGVIFAAPSFCDPALLDRPMLRAGAELDGIPCIAFQYAENTGQFQQFREQAGTFADSIKLWGDTKPGTSGCQGENHGHCGCDGNTKGPVDATAKGHDRRALQAAGGRAGNG